MKGFTSRYDLAARRHMRPLQELPCLCTLVEWYKCKRPECLKHSDKVPLIENGQTILDGG